MAFELPPLPYPKDGLEPHMSARTLEFHHGKHHATYVKTLNELVKDTPLARQSLEDVIRATANDESKTAIFNNAAQAWNHSFFWNCMRPRGGGRPDGDLLLRIGKAVGDIDTFPHQCKEAADGRRPGARLFPRLPEPSARLRPDLPRPSRELGLRREEPGEGGAVKANA